MELIDFNEYEQNDRMYGGTAGRKIGIYYEGNNYLLKFPGNMKEKQMKNVQISYSNSPLCEYIGSKIFGILGIPVHDTLLGTRNGKVVTACMDFLHDGDRLYEFEKIKVTHEPRFLDSNGNETNGAGMDLYEILTTLDDHPFLAGLPMKEFFWDMFVVDALIGNPDRNNSNWGIIMAADGSKQLAPVYDNGNCLNCKWDDQKMLDVMALEKGIETEAHNGKVCIFEVKGKRINPYKLIAGMEYPDCIEAVKRLTPVIRERMEDINKLIDGIPVVTDVQKQFYTTVLKARYDMVLHPAYEKIACREQEKNKEGMKKGRCR